MDPINNPTPTPTPEPTPTPAPEPVPEPEQSPEDVYSRSSRDDLSDSDFRLLDDLILQSTQSQEVESLVDDAPTI